MCDVESFSEDVDNLQYESQMINVINTDDDEDIFNFMQTKTNLNASELSVYMFIILKHLIRIENNKSENISDYFHSVTNLQDFVNLKSVNDIKDLYKEHMLIIENYKKKDNIVTMERENISKEINLMLTHLTSNSSIKNLIYLLQNNHLSEENSVCCLYKHICSHCKEASTLNPNIKKYDYCYNCEDCNDLRNIKLKYEKKKRAKMLIKELDEKYDVKPVKETKNKAIQLKNKQVNINNTYIQININQKLLSKNYIETKDRFFEVFISGENIDKLKHVFIYCMCRSKGIELFPDEKHNKAITHPLSSGLYTINDDNILHGLLRYKHVNSARMTQTKLKNITIKKDNNINITVNKIKLVENIQNQHCINQLTSIINTITMTNSYGSLIEDFYASDKHTLLLQ